MLLKIFSAPVPLYTSAGSLVILAPNLSFPSLPPPVRSSTFFPSSCSSNEKYKIMFGSIAA
ncbi:hypothetical protein GBAR_LOCUS15652, partial [Geodia barretti]